MGIQLSQSSICQSFAIKLSEGGKIDFRSILKNKTLFQGILAAGQVPSVLLAVAGISFIFFEQAVYSESLLFVSLQFALFAELLFQVVIIAIVQGGRTFIKSTWNIIDLALLVAYFVMLGLIFVSSAVAEPWREMGFCLLGGARVFRNCVALVRLARAMRPQRSTRPAFVTLEEAGGLGDEEEDDIGDFDDDGVLAALEKEFEDDEALTVGRLGVDEVEDAKLK